MLILARTVGEAIRIADNISIRIVSLSGNRVRIGIQAPRDVRVMREEIAFPVADLATRLQLANRRPNRTPALKGGLD